MSLQTSSTPQTLHQRIGALDGWRGLAIVALLLGHFGNAHWLKLGVGGPLNLGRLGVELFFVLSGALMARLLFVRRDPLPRFYSRRIARIVPAATVAAVLIGAALHIRGYLPDAVQILAAITFWINYFPREHLTAHGLDHFWSLSVEEHSYLVLSLVALLHRARKADPILVIVGLVALCFALAAWEGARSLWDYYAYYWRTECRASSILLGSLFALVAERRKHGDRALPDWLVTPPAATACLAAGLALQVSVIPDFLKYTLGTCLLAITVNHLDLLPKALLMILENPVLRRLGVWSFSLYLWQQPFVRYGWKGLFFAIPLGLLSFYLVENPARNFLNSRISSRLSGKQPRATEAVGASSL